MEISVVIPLYGCEPFIGELTARLKKVLEPINQSFEIIYIDDCGPLDDWERVKEEAKRDSRVKGLKLSRNFGQHYAITAGLANSTGNWIIVMDGDLQDKPEEITRLYAKTLDGYDLVLAQRKERKHSFFKKTSSRIFYQIFGYLTDSKLDSSIANFGIYHRKVVVALLEMKDHIRFFPTMVQWVGFRKVAIPVEHGERPEGNSAYSFRRLLKLAFNSMIAFSDKPLRLALKAGFYISLLSLFIGVFYVVKYFRGEIAQLGYTSLILSIWFLSGIIIFILGIVGLYIGKIFDRVKNRPMFIVDQRINCT